VCVFILFFYCHYHLLSLLILFVSILPTSLVDKHVHKFESQNSVGYSTTKTEKYRLMPQRSWQFFKVSRHHSTTTTSLKFSKKLKSSGRVRHTYPSLHLSSRKQHIDQQYVVGIAYLWFQRNPFSDEIVETVQKCREMWNIETFRQHRTDDTRKVTAMTWIYLRHFDVIVSITW